jgi:membrane associated rhomboid family serine protease
MDFMNLIFIFVIFFSFNPNFFIQKKKKKDKWSHIGGFLYGLMFGIFFYK